MGATGIVRRLDELGRIVLPMELRKSLDIQVKDAIEITAEDDVITLRKHSPACVFCGKEHNVADFKGKNVCANCLDEIKAQLD